MKRDGKPQHYCCVLGGVSVTYKKNLPNNFMLSRYRYKIIIIEANEVRRDSFRSIITDIGCLGFYFEKETICFDNMPSLDPDLVILGSLSLERSIRIIYTLKMIKYNLPILMVSNDSRLKYFICANWFSDIKFTSLEFNPLKIKVDIRSILNKKIKKINYNKKYPIIVGNSDDILNTIKKLPELSRTKESIIICGEAGTGKDLIAKAIYSLSSRINKPFIKVNCAILRRNTYGGGWVDNPLQKKIIDLHNNKKISSDVVDGGTIFFDEIEKAPNFLQAELLDLIEDNSNLKERKKINSRVKIIASTSVDLETLVKKKKFRKDLYYRLNVFSIKLTPLRQRKDDIPILADFFTDKFCKEFGKSHYELSRETKDIFCRYHWPGNTRELENVVKSAIILGKKESIIKKLCVSDKEIKFSEFANFCKNIYGIIDLGEIKNYLNNLNDSSLKDISREFIIQAEKKVMKKALETTKWNRRKTAIILNISYKSLLNKIKEYNLM